MTLKFEEKLFEVEFDSSLVTLERIFEVIKAKGYTPTLVAPGTQRKAPALTDAQRAKLDIRTVSHGETVVIEDHLVAGKFTIVDYYADWCGPCKLLGHDIETLLAERDDVALRKVDIVSWESEAAIQIKEAFELSGIPYIRIYDPTGSFVGAVNGNRIAEVRELVTPTR